MTQTDGGYVVPPHIVEAMRRGIEAQRYRLTTVIDMTPAPPPAMDRWTRLRRRWASKHP